jgi:hypothetical protein
VFPPAIVMPTDETAGSSDAMGLLSQPVARISGAAARKESLRYERFMLIWLAGCSGMMIQGKYRAAD